MTASRKKEKRDNLKALATKAFRRIRGGRGGDIPLSDFVVKDAIKFKASIAGFLTDDEIPIGYADCTDLVNLHVANLPDGSPEKHHKMQEALYEFVMAKAIEKFGEQQCIPFVFKVGEEIYLLTFYDDQEKTPRLSNILKLYSDAAESYNNELVSTIARISRLGREIEEGDQLFGSFLKLRQDIVDQKKTFPIKFLEEQFTNLEEIDVRMESLGTLLDDLNSKLEKAKNQQKQIQEKFDALANGQSAFRQLLETVEFPPSNSDIEQLISPTEMNTLILTATNDHDILLFIPDYAYAVQPDLVKRTLDRTLEFSKKQLGASGTGVDLANPRGKISPLAALMLGAANFGLSHSTQQENLKTRATQVTLESAAECRDFATIAYAKLLETLPTEVRILMMSDGLHNFVIVGYEGAIPKGILTLKDLDSQKDNILLVDLWYLTMSGDTKLWGVYTLDEYRPKDVSLKVTFDSQPTPELLKSFLTSKEISRDMFGLDSPRSTSSSFTSFSGESVSETPPEEFLLTRRSIFSTGSRSNASVNSATRSLPRAPDSEPAYAPTSLNSARTDRHFLTSSLGVPRGEAPQPSPASAEEEGRTRRRIVSRITAPPGGTRRD